MRLKITDGLLVDPVTGREEIADLYVADGSIVGRGASPGPFTADREIDASGLVVSPGLVDLAVRLREPGFEYRATLESELGAAVSGGVTSLACPPDTDPPLDEPGLVEMLKRRTASLQLARVYPVGALTQGLRGERLAELMELAEAGCVAFSQADRHFSHLTVVLRSLQYAATFDLPVWLRPEDAALANGGVAHDGEVATRLGLAGVPSLAETVAIAGMLLMARETGARLHLCRLSTAEGVDMVRRAKAAGARVTCDTSANHVHLTELDIGYFDARFRLIPPLRTLRDRDALVAGLEDGTIDAICSDHSPVDEDGKEIPFAEAEPGATGLELLLPLALKTGATGGRRLADVLKPVTAGPARVLGLEPPSLELGAVADICIFDPAESWQVVPETLMSQGKSTPFANYEMQGRARYTVVAGRVVFERRG